MAELAAADAGVLDEVRDGLGRAPKELPPKFFYDERGSELFEAITRLPEYYLTRAEAALLGRWMPEWLGALRPASLVELGAGSAVKTRLILDAIPAAQVYVPVDVSADFLESTARRVRGAYPGLEVRAVAADFTAAFALPGLPHPTLHAFLGSTIGNFAPDDAVALLRATRARMGTHDRFLMGVDLRKDPATVEAAYNDAAGVTAEFNRNMLRVVNARTGADFDVDAYEHRAFYHRAEHRIEMHLVASRAQTVTVPGAGRWTLAAGESIRTEISCKHDRASIEALFAAAGLRVERWEDDGLFAIVLGVPVLEVA
ncbi:MAG: ABC transporter ATP-binding protein [uncultured Gemmatimonadetes bacterium]|uniref:ABC transporter ATP-binding protein n=1 Tax=uncultured Gemmatimonadota bacterium TaxID=203437 RepID=A0A6J4MZM3_9BACT|nr:MAG: ABC transporter ATP-binding protein [uncultured Gemmatimonadota bacterium]